MNILYLIGSLNLGGAERQILLNASISSEKHNVIIISIGTKNNYEDFCKKNNLKIILLMKPKGKIWNLLILFKLYKIIIKNNIDLIHSFLGVPNLISYILSFFVKTNLITSWRSDVDLNSEMWKRRKYNEMYLKNYNSKESLLNKLVFFNRLTLHGKFWLPMERLITNRSKFVVFNSSESLNNHQKLFDLDPKKLKLVPNIIDVDYFSKVPKEKVKEIRTELNFYNEATLFLCVSRIIPQKNQIFLVQSFIEFEKRINTKGSHQLIICGYADESYKEKLSKAIGSNKSIILMEPTSKINKLYQAADCFIFPSRWHEANPNVLLEAMSSGLYPIVSQSADPLKIIDENKNGLIFDANNSDDLINCMLKYINKNENELNEALDYNKMIINSRYSKKYIKDNLIGLYNDLKKDKNF